VTASSCGSWAPLLMGPPSTRPTRSLPPCALECRRSRTRGRRSPAADGDPLERIPPRRGEREVRGRGDRSPLIAARSQTALPRCSSIRRGASPCSHAVRSHKPTSTATLVGTRRRPHANAGAAMRDAGIEGRVGTTLGCAYSSQPGPHLGHSCGRPVLERPAVGIRVVPLVARPPRCQASRTGGASHSSPMTNHASVKRGDSSSPATTPVRSRLRATRGSLARSVPGAAATAWLPRAAGAPGLGPVRAVDSSGGSRALGRVVRAAARRFHAGAPARSALRRAARRPNPTPDWSEPWPLVRLSPAGSCSTSSRLPASAGASHDGRDRITAVAPAGTAAPWSRAGPPAATPHPATGLATERGHGEDTRSLALVVDDEPATDDERGGRANAT
jgi:hypothetical protein